MKIKKQYAVAFLILVSILKIALHYSLKLIEVGGGNDSDYYHAYALHLTNRYTSIWPGILRLLADSGLYSRQGVSYFLLFIALIPLPLLYSKICTNNQAKSSAGYMSDAFFAFIIIALYPTIYFYTFDIYRDIVIYFNFCVCAFFAQRFFAENRNFSALFIFIFCALFAYKLRPYFRFSLTVAFVFSYIMEKFKPTLLLLFALFLFAFFILHAMELINPLIVYRKAAFSAPAGSNFGIVLENKNSFEFVILFVKSFTFNMFGVSFPNWKAIFAFFVETIPFSIALVYTFKNYNNTDQFCKFLIAFFVVYCTIWCMGNDNLGSALRLRVPAYLAIFACFIILRRKKY